MIDYITQLYAQYSEFTSSNQMLGAVVAGIVMTSVGIMFRSVPAKIYAMVYARTVFSVEFNSAVSWKFEQACEKLIHWTNEHKTIFASRQALPTFENHEKFKIGIGIGKNLIRYQGNYYIADISFQKAEETMAVNYVVRISCLWYNRSELEVILQDLFKPEEGTGINVSEWTTSYWSTHIVPKRQLSTVITTDNVGKTLVDYIDEFQKSKNWYDQTGIAYKVGIMLYGVPGTGKTSLIKAIATNLNRNLFTINVSSIKDNDFTVAIRNIPPRSILSLEDIDCVGTFHTRSTAQEETPVVSPGAQSSPQPSKKVGVNLATLLNVLDGIIPLNDIIVFMSTNHVEKIDPALLRKGRSDLSIEVKPLDGEAVNAYSMMVYNKPVKFKGTIKGCDIQSIVLEHKTDHNGFCKALYEFSEDRKWVDSKIKEITH